MSSAEVVITGIGVVSPLGTGRQAFWESLDAQRSGVAALPHLSEAPSLPCHFGGALSDFEPKALIRPRKALKVMSPEIQIGVAATTLALEDAGLERGQIDPDRIGTVYGSELLYSPPRDMEQLYRACLEDGEFSLGRMGRDGMHKLYPLWMLMLLPNMTASHASIFCDARGPSNSITMSDASSLLALYEARSIIERGRADVIVAGGIGSRINLTSTMYRTPERLSRRNDDPQRASRPFDRDRDGLVNGEGGAVFTLETRAHAERRGATIYARLLAVASSCETVERGMFLRGDSIRRVIRGALRQAQLSAADISHVNANGLSTLEDDRAEAMAIQGEIGDVPVTALKSYFGCLAAGSGAVELAGSLLSIQERRVPVTLNHETPDPACPVNVIAGQPLLGPQQHVLSLNHTRDGQAVACLLGAP